ncbi:Phosphotransferase enzyme family protein [Actinopolymorpha cephalotaxi]|uniref:Aminoglycoside phosphotransferase (APT) family kinase protein n=1 Tax=Actinopolymorpha cephalotaxi TaxID=504797 RepID=A0A1I2WI81_9ACTN|nr:phosphotransferase [Actinopolymorpha cephalotaxi]NYH82603.1 aminoglycoside phosphotransferase (APT) family kinase protein [Actinopolymorpha cephalotaxi]SFH00056.1 Phosphotransferase enzyme family protein [Actinopolymorpha cephalotaxi]
MRPLPHGYTNRTVGDGSVVVKEYAGPDARGRRRREQMVLDRLAGTIPLPPLVSAGDLRLTTGFVRGTHGQDLLAPSEPPHRAAAVLAACGRTLREIHSVDPARLSGLPTSDGAPAVPDLPGGTVLVHGDYGPNNLLLDPANTAVTAVLDWEFAHLGSAIEDVAWCEWIVRTHHPDRTPLLGEFHAAYGGPPYAWPARRAVMVARCHALEAFCTRWKLGGEGARQWSRRAAVTAAWPE